MKSGSPAFNPDDWKFRFEEDNSELQSPSSAQRITFKVLADAQPVSFSELKAFGD